MEYGQPVTVAPGLRRIVAPNPGVMTGPGTNAYLVGERAVAVVDPGPAIEAHIEAILAAGRDRISHVLVTHTHPDHSPAAQRIAAATGAPCLGMAPPTGDDHQDRTFRPDTVLSHDQTVCTDEWTLRAIHTPGHVSNHLCFLHEQSGYLMTGDHIMQGSTVVIIPPAGDMKDYMDSLARLRDYPITALAPGHGEVITDAMAEVDRLLAHRQVREDKVVTTLRRLSAVTLESLLPAVYDDVDPDLHPVAEFSLWAHLLKLEREGRVRHEGETWALTEA